MPPTKHPTKLIKIIEDYGLYELDHMVLKGKVTSFGKIAQQTPSKNYSKPIRLPNNTWLNQGVLHGVKYGIEIAPQMVE